jgi:hypothetical protein
MLTLGLDPSFVGHGPSSLHHSSHVYGWVLAFILTIGFILGEPSNELICHIILIWESAFLSPSVASVYVSLLGSLPCSTALYQLLGSSFLSQLGPSFFVPEFSVEELSSYN